MLKLHLIDTGIVPESAYPPLVVLHGLMGSADNWRTHLKHWRMSRQVIAMDLRNHGRSPHTDSMHYPHMAEDVLTTLDDLGIDTFDLVGHSMGGKVAMTLAAMAPSCVRRLVVADIAPVRYPADTHNDIFAAMQAVVDRPPSDRRTADDMMAEHVKDVDTRRFLGTNLVRNERDGKMTWRINLTALIKNYTDISGPPKKQKYDKPSLFIRGECSPYVDDEGRKAIPKYFTQARIITLKGAGHWLHAEKLDIFVDVVERFLSQ